ncbi:MAG: nucleoside kinase [Bacteroidales bacterium]|nr:nucleoside kinase [Bacteroidales bacterium]MBO4566647.1 nucleoside kinase [Bacteroidales bacterium]
MTKIEAAREEYKDWCSAVGIDTLEKVNEVVASGQAISLINLCEARQERKYAEAADQIFFRRQHSSVVMISGPSSSGKTSSSLRIAQQCRVLGISPKVIELDNFFRPREETPLDENGEYDFEALGAMNLELLNSTINDLLAGKEVIIPRFDFKTGRTIFEPERAMRLDEHDILFMEGIHALNPELTYAVDQGRIFRIYISALSALPGGEKVHNSTTDKRLLRRIVRDNRTRGISPEENILRWPSVRRGETRNIFPFEENADVVFNSSTLYDVPLLKYYAEPLLYGITEASPAYEKAQQLLSFLVKVTALKPSEIAAVPPTSIMREFIGGQTL